MSSMPFGTKHMSTQSVLFWWKMTDACRKRSCRGIVLLYEGTKNRDLTPEMYHFGTGAYMLLS